MICVWCFGRFGGTFFAMEDKKKMMLPFATFEYSSNFEPGH
jgi:hypothetical protein